MLPLWMGLAAGTLVSEDLACITAGLLIQQGAIDPLAGVTACALGIYAGDLGLWSLGRLSRRLGDMPWVVRKWMVTPQALSLREGLLRRSGVALFCSRFLPGTRLPLYVGAGFVGVTCGVFSRWVLLGISLWTPLIVLMTAALGNLFVDRVRAMLHAAWFVDVGVALAAVAVLRVTRGRFEHAMSTRRLQQV
ncbi:MAG: DedA family protein [Vicinamibacterales bacterium]